MQIGDVKVNQATRAGPIFAAYADIFIRPAVSSLWGFDENKRPFNVTLGSGLTLTAGVLSGTGGGGVTSVSGTAPISSSGGATPTISISQAGASTNGYLSSANWNTFNNKAGLALNNV